MSNILLIEDNANIRENISEILTLAGYEVCTAVHGMEGLQKAKLLKPDLIICDIVMPEMDGYGVIKEIKCDVLLKDIPFIFMSAKADKPEMKKGIELGASAYLIKPFEADQLLGLIKDNLADAQIQKAGQRTDSTDNFSAFFRQVKVFDALMSEAAHKVHRYKKKAVIYSTGSQANYLYYVLHGKVKTLKNNRHDKELITGLYNEGDFFGYTGLFEKNDYDDEALAMEDCILKCIPKDEFFYLIGQNKDVAYTFMQLLSKEVKEKEERLIRTVYGSVRKKVAESLMILKNKYGHAADENELFSIPISREDLSQIAGTATETLIRTLTDFKDEGLIEIKGSTITIINSDRLRQMKN